jgi:hypothetical protein
MIQHEIADCPVDINKKAEAPVGPPLFYLFFYRACLHIMRSVRFASRT